MFKRFEGFTQAFPSEEPQQPPTTLWAFCRHYTQGFIKPLIIIALLSMTIAIVEVALFGFMGRLVDWLSVSNPETFLADNQSLLIGLTVLILIGMPLIVAVHSLLVHQTMLGNYPMSIRWLAHRYLLKQSLSFYQDEFAGRIATKVMQTSLAIRETVMKMVDVFIYVSVYLTAILVLLGDSDWRLMLPMLLWLISYVGIQFFYVPKLKHVSSLQADARSTMTGRFVDSYTNIQTVKLFSHNHRETSYVQESMEGFLGTVYRQMRLVTGFNLSVEVANYLLLFSISAISIYLWSQQAITVGAIAVAISLALRINGMSKWIMWEIGGLFENMGTVVDGMNSLSRSIAVQDKPDAKPLQITQGAIEFDHVHFCYGTDINVINDLNLYIRPGEKVGIVGRSGAGKSTLVNLLLRFHDVESGQIRIDGQAIDAMTQDSLRCVIGMVTQDTSLLHRSIRENILYGNPQATEEQMIRAAQQAHAHEFIETLSDPHGNRGYDAQVGERGIKLSGGQRQRIAITRVLLKNAPILILDEATSALDSEVEAAIQESLYELMEGKTVIAIAHRLSTIAAMDRLIVLDQGKIVEEGTHQALLAKHGIYAHLWQHQTGGFIGCK
ncbi:ABC transporter ATP-binding protein [Vibrio gazogenes]|uniref:ATP-binding cassette, subfamily B, multidrug efflux pump n=1 Tax=Vibrio gazogenes DSM 21264 = NBRC 103151 TaxID=1123492 RepID=A0A1M4T3T7_VIBGA|nr:ABC transporter ATP-binding protein [Vibrio gazogenes]USP16019.1 ABC transporter ATP-binding protein/permease [Vibrio gazogenes]SHE39192.1 ATP-binding cassette, subfamily B, multidrug efflux pump [Vibrio gazogenes DSM 21264] [Vibrio gazogenes DSM 21264 = NBRC 103151]